LHWLAGAVRSLQRQVRCKVVDQTIKDTEMDMTDPKPDEAKLNEMSLQTTQMIQHIDLTMAKLQMEFRDNITKLDNAMMNMRAQMMAEGANRKRDEKDEMNIHTMAELQRELEDNITRLDDTIETMMEDEQKMASNIDQMQAQVNELVGDCISDSDSDSDMEPDSRRKVPFVKMIMADISTRCRNLVKCMGSYATKEHVNEELARLMTTIQHILKETVPAITKSTIEAMSVDLDQDKGKSKGRGKKR